MLCSNAFGSEVSVELSVLPVDAPYLARFSELGLFESPSVDLYRRAEDLGVNAVICAPWAVAGAVETGGSDLLKYPAERYRSSIERFAETIIDKCR